MEIMSRRNWMLASALGVTSFSMRHGSGRLTFAPGRKRRILFNDDAYQQRQHLKSVYHVIDEQSFLAARTTPTFDTQVDTYVWCVGNGSEPPWGPWGLEHRAPIYPVLGSTRRATDLIVNACHAQGLEVWGSLRINDVHDANVELAETNDPLKAQYPEYLVGGESDRDLPEERIERLHWSAFNFERPEVREHRLSFIRRNASAHDFDGYELDFTRFIWNFPQGRELDLAPMLTDFMRRVRQTLNDIAKKRGRPYTLIVHVMDSVEASLLLGQDVEAWLKERLVDVVVVGMGGLPFTLPMDQWSELGARFGVPIYPSLHPRRSFHHSGRQNRRTIWQDWLRGQAAWSLQSGADGIYLFNLFTVADRWRYPKDVAYAPLREVGDLSTMRGKNQLFAIEPVSAGGMFSQAGERPALPIALDRHERRLALPMGPHADRPGVRSSIYITTQGGDPEARLLLRINHVYLSRVRRDGDLWTAAVEPGVLRPGRNDLTLWSNAELEANQNPIIVREVIVGVEG